MYYVVCFEAEVMCQLIQFTKSSLLKCCVIIVFILTDIPSTHVIILILLHWCIYFTVYRELLTPDFVEAQAKLTLTYF